MFENDIEKLAYASEKKIKVMNRKSRWQVFFIIRYLLQREIWWEEE